MTQTAQKPVQLTLEAMVAKFRDSRPDLIAPFEQIKPELEAGTGAQVLSNLIATEVKTRSEGGLTVYCWTGKTDTFELKVLKPFDPQPQRLSEAQQQAQAQEPQAVPEMPPQTPEPAQTPQAAETLPANHPPLPETTENAAQAAAEITPGLFTALSDLLGDSTLLMTVAPTGEADGQPVLTVTVVPRGEEDAFSPVCLTGTVAELDTHFVSALTAKADSKKSLEAQIEALAAADKALEEAKKAEVAAKNKQTEAKKKATQKKEEDAKAEEKKAEEKAEAEKSQEALF